MKTRVRTCSVIPSPQPLLKIVKSVSCLYRKCIQSSLMFLWMHGRMAIGLQQLYGTLSVLNSPLSSFLFNDQNRVSCHAGEEEWTYPRWSGAGQSRPERGLQNKR